jgi:hypothetical protein
MIRSSSRRPGRGCPDWGVIHLRTGGPDGPDRAMTGTCGRWTIWALATGPLTTRPRPAAGDRDYAPARVVHRHSAHGRTTADEQANGIRTAHDRTAGDRHAGHRATAPRDAGYDNSHHCPQHDNHHGRRPGGVPATSPGCRTPPGRAVGHRGGRRPGAAPGHGDRAGEPVPATLPRPGRPARRAGPPRPAVHGGGRRPRARRSRLWARPWGCCAATRSNPPCSTAPAVSPRRPPTPTPATARSPRPPAPWTTRPPPIWRQPATTRPARCSTSWTTPCRPW